MTGHATDDWGTWLRKYRLGDWDARAIPIKPTNSNSAHPQHRPSAGEVLVESSRSNSGSAQPDHDDNSETKERLPVAEPTTSLDDDTADRIYQNFGLDPDTAVESRAFFMRNGWLAAPLIQPQQRHQVIQALYRHGAKASAILDLHIKHAKAVFKCSYASAVIQTLDDNILLILAQDGGDPMVQEVLQDVSLCSHAMLLPNDQVMVVPDSTKDWRFSSCPATLADTSASEGGHPMQFYASAPLKLSYSLAGKEGLVQVGRLCIMDEQPRAKFDQGEADLLSAIAKMASDALEKDFQSSRNAKAAEMQRCIGSLARSIDSSHHPGHVLPPHRSGRNEAMPQSSIKVIEQACRDIRECLGATVVAAFDDFQACLRSDKLKDPSHRRNSNYQAYVRVPADSTVQRLDLLPDNPNFHTNRVSAARYLDFHKQGRSDVFKNDEVTVHEVHSMGRALSSPRLVDYSGPPEHQQLMLRISEQLKAVYTAPATIDAEDTQTNTRCRFYRKQTTASSSKYVEFGDSTLLPSFTSSPRCSQGLFADLLPLDGEIGSFAVCASHRLNRALPDLVFVIMFLDQATCFEAQEVSFVETATQLAFGSLLRQERSTIESYQADFLRHVQHNLRTPLHEALGALDFLRATVDADDSSHADVSLELSTKDVLLTSLESMSLSSLTLQTHIEDLLNFHNSMEGTESNSGPDIILRANLVKVIEVVADEEWELLQRLKARSVTLKDPKRQTDCAHGIELIIESTPEILDCEVEFNGKSFQLAMRKLISNALRFTEEGYVEILVRLADTATHCPQRKDGIVSAAPLLVEVVISDTGSGMTEDFCRHQLMQPYTKADSFKDGIGLGTTIAIAEIDKCGGRLAVFSKVDEGTSFSVVLPVQQVLSTQTKPAKTLPNFKLLTVLRIAFFGFETRGLRRVATAISDYFETRQGTKVSPKISEADCIVVPTGALAELGKQTDHLKALKASTKYVVLGSSDPARADHLEETEVLGGRAVLTLSAPYGPSSMQLMEAFLSDKDEQPPPELIVRDGAAKSVDIGHQSALPDVANSPFCEAQRCVDNASRQPADSPTLHHKTELTTGLLASSSSAAEFRVLVVEDNPINMKLLVTICNRLKIRCEEAYDGLEAVSKFCSFRPSVVLLDISLPGQDGFQACEQMRSQQGDTPCFIVALTALNSEEDRVRGIERCGMDVWLTKPVSMRRMRDNLEYWRTTYKEGGALALLK